ANARESRGKLLRRLARRGPGGRRQRRRERIGRPLRTIQKEMTIKSTLKWIALSAGGSIALAAAIHAADSSYKVQVWDEMFPKPPAQEMPPGKKIEYKPLDKAAKKWDICVSFPHM